MLRDLFFKDFGWKLFSLLLAAFIWYTVHKIIEGPRAAAVLPANIPVEYGEVPVTLMADSADVHAYSLNSNTVSVTVSGPPDAMNVLEANQIRATVDISGFDDKTRQPYLRVDVSVPWGVTVQDVEPAKVRVIPPSKP